MATLISFYSGRSLTLRSINVLTLGSRAISHEALKKKKLKLNQFVPREVTAFELFAKEQGKLDFVTNKTHKRKYAQYCKRWDFMLDEEKQPYIDQAEAFNEARFDQTRKD
uniref:HMG box domain-containing protein n=1 Tax=Amphimedon queenslandica TaxID=400682 RepID=A0A1X7V3J6_AMPQE